MSKSEKLSPIQGLSRPDRVLLCKSAAVTPISPKIRLDATEESRWYTYLIDGQMEIMQGNSRQAVVTGDSRRASAPLFLYPAPQQWAVATESSKVLRFDREQTELLLLKEQAASGTEPTVAGDRRTGSENRRDDGEDRRTDREGRRAYTEVRRAYAQDRRADEEDRRVDAQDRRVGKQDRRADNTIFSAIRDAFKNNKLAVPSLPDVALKIRHVVNNTDVGTAEVAQIIQADPVLTGRIINVANSSTMRGVHSVTSVMMAVTRLGLKATRDLAFILAVKELFRCKNKMIADQVSQLYSRSVNVAALSYVLARRINNLDPEHAQLAGLMHCIGGLSILHYADKYPEIFTSASQLQATVANLRQVVSHWILTKWEFEQEMCEMPQSSSDWNRSTGGEIDYIDIVIAAQLQYAACNPSTMGDIPALANVAVGKKLMSQGIDLSDASNFFDEAKDEIAIVKSLIS